MALDAESERLAELGSAPLRRCFSDLHASSGLLKGNAGVAMAAADAEPCAWRWAPWDGGGEAMFTAHDAFVMHGDGG